MKHYLISIVILISTLPVFAHTTSVIRTGGCVTVDTYVNFFKKWETKSCAKKDAIRNAEQACSSVNGYIEDSSADANCSMLTWSLDRYTCTATANITCTIAD